MSKLAWLIINTLSLFITLFANYYSTAFAEEGQSVGEISDRFSTLITPAGYAFAIWGIIYLALLLFVGFQWYQYLTKKEDQLREIGIWFLVSNLANTLWIMSWTSLMIDTSVIVIFLLLLSLIQLTVRLRLEIWDAPVRIIMFVWWPLVIYLGWIILASVVNVAAWLVSTGWDGGIFSPDTWTVVMLLAAMLIYIGLIFTRNLRESAAVGIWGISAIAMRHWGTETLLAYTAIAVCIVLFLAISYHGYRNRATSPFIKLRRGEF